MLTIDVEDWFHILDSPAVPAIEKWDSLESRLERNLERILEILDEHDVKGTFFWLGWIAERHRDLVLRCQAGGHEIASHSYGHVLAYETGREQFRQDIDRAKKALEDITGQPILGFRAPGFGITGDARWAFDVIEQAGYTYDSSVFPTNRGHGGIAGSQLGPHLIETSNGPLREIPMSIVEVMGKRFNLFGGGYLRISPLWLIRWGIERLKASNQPLVIYLHPREIDPDHPRLPLGTVRRFKSYVNLKSTAPKLEWLCHNLSFRLMRDFSEEAFE